MLKISLIFIAYVVTITIISYRLRSNRYVIKSEKEMIKKFGGPSPLAIHIKQYMPDKSTLIAEADLSPGWRIVAKQARERMKPVEVLPIDEKAFYESASGIPWKQK